MIVVKKSKARKSIPVLIAISALLLFTTGCDEFLSDDIHTAVTKQTASVVSTTPKAQTTVASETETVFTTPAETSQTSTTTTTVTETQKTTVPETKGDVKNLEFKWEYGGSTWTYTTSIYTKSYEAYRAISRDDMGYDYQDYVTYKSDDEWLANLANVFKNEGESYGLSEYEIIEMITAFVQTLEYVTDEIGTDYEEYPKFPIETIYDGGGDCEDSSILLASLIRELDYGVAMIEFDDHMGIGILGDDSMTGVYYADRNGKKYFYIETTDTGWGIGELPEDLEGKTAKVIPV